MWFAGIKPSRGLLVAWAFLFVSLAGAANWFERSRIEAWSKVRFVSDPQGVRFSRNPEMLCSAGEALLLPRGIAVEALEHRNCGPGRLLGADEPRRTGMWDVERVKILDGPSAGLEGWVLAYGVSGY
jgi:hypothetical protein